MPESGRRDPLTSAHSEQFGVRSPVLRRNGRPDPLPRIAKGRIATVAVNEFIFKQPVSVGDLVSFYARVLRVGNTSITVHVEVYAERNPANLQVVKVTEANLTYVAIDAAGKPRPVPRPGG